MRRFAVELPMMATVAAIIAILVLVAGRSIEPPAQPVVLPSRGIQVPDEAAEACLEAPVSTPSGADIVGGARLCYHGARLRVSLHASSLTPGEVRSAVLTYVAHPATCTDATCRPLDLPDERSLGLNLRVDGVLVSPTRAVELHAELPDTTLPIGAQVSVLLILPSGQAGPAIKAVFTTQ